MHTHVKKKKKVHRDELQTNELWESVQVVGRDFCIQRLARQQRLHAALCMFVVTEENLNQPLYTTLFFLFSLTFLRAVTDFFIIFYFSFYFPCPRALLPQPTSIYIQLDLNILKLRTFLYDNILICLFINEDQ